MGALTSIIEPLQNILYRYNMTFPMFLIILGVSLIVICTLYSVIDVNIKYRRNIKYINRFEEIYQQEKDIRKTLETIVAENKPNSVVSKACKAALYYLSFSIMRDYRGALNIISSQLKSKKVQDAHEKYIVMEEQKAAIACLPMFSKDRESMNNNREGGKIC